MPGWKHLVSHPSRRSVLKSAGCLLGLPFVARTTKAWAQDRLAGNGDVVVFSYGGSFTEGIRRTVYESFTKATGIKVVDVVADLAEPQVKAMHHAGPSIGTSPISRRKRIRPCTKPECSCRSVTASGTKNRWRARRRILVSKTQSWGSLPRSFLLTTSASFRESARKTGRIFGRQKVSGTAGT